MPQSLAAVYLHLVFSTKGHTPFLKDKTFRDSVHEYLGAVCKRLNITPVCVGGVEDHVHILGRMDRVCAIAEWVKEVKRMSSIWIHKHEGYQDFHWQSGYGVFSTGRTELDRVVRYIKGQEEHHREKTYRDELLETLQEYGVEYDEKLLWE